MATKSKGHETQNKIIQSARYLFSSQGYSDTTIRQITSHANVNLGLFSYYYESKAHLASIIYNKVREQMNDLVAQYYSPNTVEHYLMRVLYSLKISITSDTFYEIYFYSKQHPDHISGIMHRIEDAISNYAKVTPSYGFNSYNTLVAYTIVGLNTELVNAGRNKDNPINVEIVIKYYLNLYLDILGLSHDYYDKIINEEWSKYYMGMVDNFTPIFTKILI